MLMYPRPLGPYAKQSSLNFDMMRSKIYENRKGEDLALWIAHGVAGILMAIVIYLLVTLVDTLVALRMNIT